MAEEVNIEEIPYDDAPPTIIIDPEDDDKKINDEKQDDDNDKDEDEDEEIKNDGDDDNNNKNSDAISITIRTLTGKAISLKIKKNITVQQLKKIICKKQKIKDEPKLIFDGNLMDNFRTLSFYKISQDSSIFLILRARNVSKENESITLSILEKLDNIEVCKFDKAIDAFKNRIEIKGNEPDVEKGKKEIKLLKDEKKLEHISEDELLSIYLYTTNLIYKQFNEDCRKSKIEGWEPIIKNMLLCLRKLPFCWETCYRGMQDYGIEYKVGSKFAWEQFASSSIEIDVAKKFAKAANNKRGVIFKIKHWTGRNIQSFSRYKLEGEVLLMPCSFYEVLKIEHEEAYTLFECEEIPLPWGKHHVLWVDDDPHKNKKLMQDLEGQGISTVIRKSTKAAIELLDQQDKLLTKPMSEFRIVTDMVRVHNNVSNFHAGAELIKELREKGYKQQILVYCGDEDKATQNCKDKGVDLSNVIITKSSKKLKEFCKFN